MLTVIPWWTGGVVLGVGEWSFTLCVSEDEVEVQGTEARLRFSCFDNQPASIVRRGAEEDASAP